MDYDATTLPREYDKGRSLAPEVLDLWMGFIARLVTPGELTTIVDLGCGTGRFSDALALRFAAKVIGIDPSTKMLDEARGKRLRGMVRLVRGVGEAIPLANDVIDLVFTSMAYHHFTDAAKVAWECRRIGRKAAVVIVRTGTRDRIHEYAYVPFIPATRPLLEQRLPSADEIIDTFETAGFDFVSADLVVQQIAPSYEAYAERLEAGGDSILASLTPAVLAEGLRSIRTHSARVDPRPVTEPIDMLVFRAP